MHAIVGLILIYHGVVLGLNTIKGANLAMKEIRAMPQYAQYSEQRRNDIARAYGVFSIVHGVIVVLALFLGGVWLLQGL
jgi:hypothetical protein